MVSSSLYVLAAQSFAHALPRAAGELGALVSSCAAHQVVLAGLPLNPSPLKQVVDSLVWLSWHHFLLKHNLPSSAEFPPHSEVKLEQKRLLSMFFN